MHVTCVADARLVPPRWPSPGEDPQRALPPGRHKAPMAAVSRAELSRSGSLSWVQAFRGTPTRCATRFLPDCRVDGRPPPATASSRRWGHTPSEVGAKDAADGARVVHYRVGKAGPLSPAGRELGCGALPAAGWQVRLASGSLGQPGEPTHAASFFAGIDVAERERAAAEHRETRAREIDPDTDANRASRLRGPLNPE